MVSAALLARFFTALKDCFPAWHPGAGGGCGSVALRPCQGQQQDPAPTEPIPAARAAGDGGAGHGVWLSPCLGSPVPWGWRRRMPWGSPGHPSWGQGWREAGSCRLAKLRCVGPGTGGIGSLLGCLHGAPRGAGMCQPRAERSRDVHADSKDQERTQLPRTARF